MNYPACLSLTGDPAVKKEKEENRHHPEKDNKEMERQKCLPLVDGENHHDGTSTVPQERLSRKPNWVPGYGSLFAHDEGYSSESTSTKDRPSMETLKIWVKAQQVNTFDTFSGSEGFDSWYAGLVTRLFIFNSQ